MALPTKNTPGYGVFRGRVACDCLIAWLPVYEAELKRRGGIKYNLDIWQLTGAGSKSGGTHSRGGAFDIGQVSNLAVWLARQMGADPDWHRRYNWDNRGGMSHNHGVLRGCPHNEPARYQIASTAYGVDHNHNGLANGGRDDGPRPLSGRTWKEGIAWAKSHWTVPTRVTTFSVYEQNCASDKSYWATRSGWIADRIKLFKPHFVSAVELYDDRRANLSTSLKLTYALSSYYRGKVQYGRRNLRGWTKVTSRHYALGNGKHAVAVRWRHRSTRAEMVLVTAHLSWEHAAARDRKDEAAKLVGFLRADFPGLPWLVTGDMNDSHKSIASRPNDSSGDVFKAAGLHDLYYDIADVKNKVNREYNTANGYKTPPPMDAVHIDRYWGTKHFKGKTWLADVLEKEAADHWGVQMVIDLTHPK